MTVAEALRRAGWADKMGPDEFEERGRERRDLEEERRLKRATRRLYAWTTFCWLLVAGMVYHVAHSGGWWV